MTARARFASGAPIQPKEPLTEPFILWDTRSWDGSTGVGTGGIPNEGFGGSAFDLDVAEIPGGLNGLLRYRAKQGPLATSASWVNSPSIDWDDLGGESCDAPWTVMMAVGSLPYAPEQSGDGYAWCRCMLNTAAQGPSGTSHLFMFNDWNLAAGDQYDGSTQMAVGRDNGGSFPYLLYTEIASVAPSTGDMVRAKLLVSTFDPIDGGGTFWRGPANPVVPRFVSGGPVPPSWINDELLNVLDTKGGCDLGGSGSAIDTNWRFCGVGDHVGYAAPVPGEAWNSVIGVAMFRGEPTAADIAYWEDYFYNDYVPWVNPVAYTGGEIAVDDTYVYHRFDSGGGTLGQTALPFAPISGASLPSTIDFLMVGGGGQNQGARPGGGGEVIQEFGVTAPVASTDFFRGYGQGYNTFVGADATFMGFTALRGGRAGFGAGSDAGDSGSGNAGGTSSPVANSAGGGGGGDGGVGQNATGGGLAGVAGQGGPGTANDWFTGSNEYYGTGGTGGAQNAANIPAPPTDGAPGKASGVVAVGRLGGGTGGVFNSPQFDWGRGCLLVRYLRQD